MGNTFNFQFGPTVRPADVRMHFTFNLSRGLNLPFLDLFASEEQRLEKFLAEYEGDLEKLQELREQVDVLILAAEQEAEAAAVDDLEEVEEVELPPGTYSVRL